MKADAPIDSSGLPGALLAALLDQAQRAGVGRLALVGGVVRDVLLHARRLKHRLVPVARIRRVLKPNLVVE